MSEHAPTAPEPVYRQHPDVLFTELGETEAVLLSLPASRYYTLNETGSRVWQALDGGATPARVARALENAFEVAPPDALANARAFVGELLREGLIEVAGPAGS